MADDVPVTSSRLFQPPPLPLLSPYKNKNKNSASSLVAVRPETREFSIGGDEPSLSTLTVSQSNGQETFRRLTKKTCKLSVTCFLRVRAAATAFNWRRRYIFISCFGISSLFLLPLRRLVFLFLTIVIILRHPFQMDWDLSSSQETFEISESIGVIKISNVFPPLVNLNVTKPRVMLILGGDEIRERLGIEFFSKYRHIFATDAKVVVSSGELTKNQLLSQTSISPEDLDLDDTAVDTLSNFTTLIESFLSQGLEMVAFATSSYHFVRSMAIAKVLLGSTGIPFIGIELKHPFNPARSESFIRIVRDVFRALIWVFTNLDFKSTSAWIQHHFPGMSRETTHNNTPDVPTNTQGFLLASSSSRATTAPLE